MYDFYDNKRGFEDGMNPKLCPMDCPYNDKAEIIMWTMGFVEGRKKYYEDNPRKETNNDS